MSSNVWSLLLSSQALNTAFTNVANGIAKNTPQNPQIPPKNNTAIIIYRGCKLTASENNIGKEFPSKAFRFHFKDNLECLGWRTDSKDPLREFAYECLRRNLLFSKIKDEEVIRSCFLFPEVYDQLLNKKLSISTFSDFDLI